MMNDNNSRRLTEPLAAYRQQRTLTSPAQCRDSRSPDSVAQSDEQWMKQPVTPAIPRTTDRVPPTATVRTAAPYRSNDRIADRPVTLCRPQLALYHPNGKGTGCALKMELIPANGSAEGAIMATMANQMSVGDRGGPNPTFARFDWERAIFIKLGFNDLCRFLQVFRGECESIGDGRGLYHRSARATTRIVLCHVIEPMQGYSLELYRTAADGAESRSHLMLNPAEALGLTESIAGAMHLVAFGVPLTADNGASAHRVVKEVRNASAA